MTVLSFMAPAALGILFFFVYPLLTAVYFSFHQFSVLSTPVYVGMRNYSFALHDPNLQKAVENTLWLVVVMVPAQVLFGLGTGMLLVAMRRSASVYRTLFYLPALVPPVAGTLAFVYVFKPQIGPVDTILKTIGIDGPGWFTDPDWAKPSLTLLALWGIGNTMIIFLAALLDVPAALLEAASLDGANAWQRFRHVTLPTLSPVLVFTTITSIIYTLQYFTQAAVAAGAASGQVTAGGNSMSNNFGFPQGSTFTYPLWMYIQGFPDGHLGYANALAVLLFFASFAVIAIVLRRARSFHGESS